MACRGPVPIIIYGHLAGRVMHMVAVEHHKSEIPTYIKNILRNITVDLPATPGKRLHFIVEPGGC